MAKSYDPLKCIPSADAIRKRLEEVRETARRLNILLKTAEEIEREQHTHARRCCTQGGASVN